MKWRLAVLALVLFSRLFFNLAVTSRYRLGEPVRVRFDNYKIERSGSECIISRGVFWLKNDQVCSLKQAGAVAVSGTFRASLIDRLLGRVWLEESSHYTIETAGESEKTVSDGRPAGIRGISASLRVGVAVGTAIIVGAGLTGAARPRISRVLPSGKKMTAPIKARRTRRTGRAVKRVSEAEKSFIELNMADVNG